MVAHSLALRSFHTDVALTGRREDGLPLGREVSRIVRDMLPPAISAALLPLLGNRDGVLRINSLAVKLRFERGEMSALRLADALAREIAHAIAERVEQLTAAQRIEASFAWWPDHASFAAAYLAQRLRLVPAPDWAFRDFHPLTHLAPHEAALELVAAGPSILAALARLIGAPAATALAARLPETTAQLLIARLMSGPGTGWPESAETELAAMLARLPVDAEAQPARTALAAAAGALALLPSATGERVCETVMLAHVAVALAALKAATLGAWGRPPRVSDLDAEALPHLPAGVRQLVQATLVPLTQAGPRRAELVRLLDGAHRRSDATKSVPPQTIDAAAAQRTIESRVAGIGLLLPTALAHGLPERLSAAAFNRVLAAAGGSEVEAAARLDPLLFALAPFDPGNRDETFPPVPDALRAGVPEPRRESLADTEGAAGWAACLSHSFAAGLSGFESSSLSYLRRQFLVRPGTLHVAEDQLTLVLDPLPLGILLRIAGLHGWSAGLPQVRGARLRIEIRES